LGSSGANVVQALVADAETKRFDQMQLSPGIGAQADDVAGIGRDFRLVEDDGEHGWGAG
jgi:hypothetical protein